MEDLLDHSKKEIARSEFKIRTYAFLTDIAIVILVTTVVFFLIKYVPEISSLLIFIYCLMIFGYYMLEAFSGQTPGKNYRRIVVVNADGTAASTGKLFFRFLIKFSGGILSLFFLLIGEPDLVVLGSLVSLLFFIGCFFALSEKRQTLHDMIAGTAVFRKRDLK